MAIRKMHPAVSNGTYDVARIREDFPILAMQVYGKPLVYLDNAASAQKPKAVLDRIQHAYTAEYANVHRGLHYLANAATEAYEDAREKVRSFLNAARKEEIIFTRNATEAINLVAYTFGRERIKAGDEIVLSIMEHHSNIVPWHFLRERQGAVIKWAPVDDDGNFLIDEFEKLLSPRTRMVARHPHVEHARHPGAGEGGGAARACARHSGAASTARRPRCTSTSTCRTSAAISTPSPATSSTGRAASACSTASTSILAAMPPFNGGGEMIREVFEDRITYGEPPHKFEAGTPPIVQAIGLGAAIDYVNSIGKARISAHEAALVALCAGAAARDQFAAHLRHRQGQGPDRLVRDQGRPSARCRDHHRPLGRRGARRHPLRDAAVGPLRRRPPPAGRRLPSTIPARRWTASRKP